MSKFILVLLVAIAAQVLGQPAYLNEKSTQCYERECPSTTTACKREIKTSDDKKSLNTVIYCMDAQDMVLKDYRESKENPFGSSTTFQSTSFSGTYVSSSGGPIHVNINNDVAEPIDNTVEDFS